MTSQPVKKITAGQVDDQKTDGLLNYTIFSKKIISRFQHI